MIPPDQFIGQTSKVIDIHDHFAFTNTSVNTNAFTRNVANSGTTAVQASVSGRPGLWRMGTGTTNAAGLSRVFLQNGFNLGNLSEFLYEASFRVSPLPTSTQNAGLIFGLIDTQVELNDKGIFFYTSNAYTNKLQCFNRNTAASTTVVDSNITLVASTFYDLAIQYKSGIGSAFYINNSLVSTINTNLPPNSTLLYPIALVNKSVGTGTAVIVDLDFIRFRALLT